MIQLVAKLLAVLTFFGLSSPLIMTFTYLGALMDTDNKILMNKM
jgi:hypothetical protein